MRSVHCLFSNSHSQTNGMIIWNYGAGKIILVSRKVEKEFEEIHEPAIRLYVDPGDGKNDPYNKTKGWTWYHGK